MARTWGKRLIVSFPENERRLVALSAAEARMPAASWVREIVQRACGLPHQEPYSTREARLQERLTVMLEPLKKIPVILEELQLINAKLHPSAERKSKPDFDVKTEPASTPPSNDGSEELVEPPDFQVLDDRAELLKKNGVLREEDRNRMLEDYLRRHEGKSVKVASDLVYQWRQKRFDSQLAPAK